MIKVLLFASLSTLVFIGCTSTQINEQTPVYSSKGYGQRMLSWKGLPETQLVRNWGIPQQVYKSGKSKFLVYNKIQNIHIPGESPYYATNFMFGTAYTHAYGGSPARNIQHSCQTTFEIIDDKVYSISYKGDMCIAAEQPETIRSYQQPKLSSTYDPKKSPPAAFKINKNYASLNLNTKEKKAWFRALTKKLQDGKISKDTFIKEGLKRYPTKEKEFNQLAKRILNQA